MGPPKHPASAFRNQSQRLQAALDSSGTGGNAGQAPAQPGGLLGSAQRERPLPGSGGKLNTPTKRPGGFISAPGAGLGLKELVRTGGSMSAQANGTAGHTPAHDEYAFPDDREDDELQRAYAASMVSPAATTAAAVAGTGGPAQTAGASAGPPKLKGRLKVTADAIMAKVDRDTQRNIARNQAADGLDVTVPPDSPPPRPGSAEAIIAAKAAVIMKQGPPPGTNRQGPPAAAAAGQPGTQAQPWVSKQMDIRQFTRKVPVQGPSTLQPLPAGMLNHGNTCYLNAILQALLSLPCLARDLSQFDRRSKSSSDSGGEHSSQGNEADRGSGGFSQLQLPPNGVTAAMVVCLQQYQAACSRARGADNGSATTTAISPQVVREAMKQRASHWGAMRQEDAHEFFTALLNALADEVQQAQLEYMQHASSSKQGRQQAAARHSAALPSPAGPAEPAQPDTSSALDLPPSAVEAAQACQAGAQSDTDEPSAAAAVPVPPDDADLDADLEEEAEQQQQQQQKHRQQVLGQSPRQQQGSSPDAAAAAAGPQPASRQATPACQLPGMSVSQSLCPVTRNFLGCLQHTYTCSVCGKQTVQKEQFNHLILDLPQEDDCSGSNGSNDAAASLFGSAAGSNRAPVADLSALLANHFNAETCEKACEGCGAAEVQHQVQHAVRRLPRVLVVQLKRFKWVIKDGFMECRKMPTPVQPDKQLFLGRLCVPGRPVPPLLAALMPPRLIRCALEAAGEQPQPKQQQQPLLGNSAAADGTTAAVAVGGREGLLQLPASSAQAGATAADNDVVADAGAAAAGQQQDQQRKKPAAKRLGTVSGLQQQVKKPKVVDGDNFAGGQKGPNNSLANFFKPNGNKPRVHIPNYLTAPTNNSDPAIQRQQGKTLLPFSHDWNGARKSADGALGDVDNGEVMPGLRRNNSSSAIPRLDLTGLADVADAAADDEYKRDLQMALALSMQEQHGTDPQQQQQQQRQQQQQQGKQQVSSSGQDTDAAVPDVDDQQHLPTWFDEQYLPAAAATPPGSPMDVSSPDAAGHSNLLGGTDSLLQQQRQELLPLHDHSPAGLDLAACTPDPAAAAVADGIFGLTPPEGLAEQEAQNPVPPPSPSLLAPRPDRGGHVSSSTGPQQRPTGHKLGGGAQPSAAASVAAAAAALQRMGGKGQPKLLEEVAAAGISEDEQLARAIAESMREHQGPPAAAAAAAAANADADNLTAAAAAADKGDRGSPMHIDTVVISDAADDEEAIMKQVLEESAAEHERQQQQKLLELQQQAAAMDASLAAVAADAGDAPGSAAAAAAAGGVGDAPGSNSSGQQEAKQDRPPALLLRLLEDSDYEAEQQQQQQHFEQQLPADTLQGAGGEQPQQKRRRGRPRKQQQQQQQDTAAADAADVENAAAAAAAAGVGGKRASRRKARGTANADAAPGAATGAAVGSGGDASLGSAAEGGLADLAEDKENLSAAAAAAGRPDDLPDTDTLPDRPAGRAAAGKKAAAAGPQKSAQQRRRALGEILGSSSAHNAAAGAAAAAAAVGAPPQKPPAVAAAVAASRAAAAAGGEAAVVAAAAAAAAAVDDGVADEVQGLQEGVAAGAVGSWPQETAASYSLSAVVRHMGDLVSVGHFTSDVYNHEVKRWFHYDDSHVRQLPGIQAVARTCERDGYLFFYVNDAIAEN